MKNPKKTFCTDLLGAQIKKGRKEEQYGGKNFETILQTQLSNNAKMRGVAQTIANKLFNILLKLKILFT